MTVIVLKERFIQYAVPRETFSAKQDICSHEEGMREGEHLKKKKKSQNILSGLKLVLTAKS